MIRRRTLTPPSLQIPPELLANRRRSPRRELSERVRLETGERAVAGWTLNVSVGGLRVVIENSLDPGTELTVWLDGRTPRPGRIMWVQDEPDGSIVGVCFLDGVADRQGVAGLEGLEGGPSRLPRSSS
ncbi:PilZ domain-containing protein [Sorangium sp. So ce375]|uniref:PilZ domain-containing protein n=1 Tax=Sorangium sp. So ce375 TaxID=3133306 RepID=UPI003F5B2384